MSRLAPLAVEAMSAEQRRVHDSILARPRGKVGGPFPALLRSPTLADRVQELGAALRFESSLAPDVRELAILCVARHTGSAVEWNAHVAIALRKGVPESAIAAVLHGHDLSDLPASQCAGIAFCRELCASQNISDAVYLSALEQFGETGLVELTTITGYFTLLAMILNAFDVPPEDRDGIPPDALRLPELG